MTDRAISPLRQRMIEDMAGAFFLPRPNSFLLKRRA